MDHLEAATPRDRFVIWNDKGQVYALMGKPHEARDAFTKAKEALLLCEGMYTGCLFRCRASTR